MESSYREVLRAIIIGDYPKFLEKLDTLGDENVTMDISIEASKRGRLDMLRELKRRGHSWNETISEMAAANGNLLLLKWLRQNDCPWDEQLVNAAASNNQLACMAWAIENGCSVFLNVMEWASDNSSKDCISYLVKKGIGDIHAPCKSAAEFNNVSQLEWCYTRNYPFDENTIIECMYNDCVESLSSLHNRGCPWDSRAYRTAKLFNSKRCLEYLHENGAPGDWSCPDCSICNNNKMKLVEKIACKPHELYIEWLSDGALREIIKLCKESS